MNFNGKVAIVTGGAQGLGRAISKALLEAGMKVIIFSFSFFSICSLIICVNIRNNGYLVGHEISPLFRGKNV